MPATLPPIVVNRPGRITSFWLPLLLAGAVGAGFVSTDESGGIRDALGGIVAVAVIVAGTLALVFRYERRSRAQLLAEAPPGSVYASKARTQRSRPAESTKREHVLEDLQGGVLTIGSTGIAYLSPDLPDTRLAWAEIDKVEVVHDYFLSPHQAVLEAWTGDQVLSWRVPGAAALASALERLQA